jgi:hypothetical protein
MRPGSLRRQLRFAARRFRLGLLLGGVCLVGSAVVRLTFSQGLVSDFGPHVLAVEVQKSDQALQIDFCPPTGRGWLDGCLLSWTVRGYAW